MVNLPVLSLSHVPAGGSPAFSLAHLMMHLPTCFMLSHLGTCYLMALAAAWPMAVHLLQPETYSSQEQTRYLDED